MSDLDDLVKVVRDCGTCCAARHPCGRTCSATPLHVDGHPDRRPHVFYEFGWPIEWTDDADGATPSPWTLRLRELLAPQDRETPE